MAFLARLGLLTALFAAVLVDPAVACAGGHIQANLGGFPAEAQSRPMYWGVESQGTVTVTVRIYDAVCDGSTSHVNYQAEDGTALTGVDYTRPPGVVTVVNAPGHPTQVTVPVQLTDNPIVDPIAVQSATFRLTTATNAGIVHPSAAPVFIVDDDGVLPRVSFAPGGYEEFEGSGGGVIPVFKAGNGAGTVSYSVTGGSAQAGRDYDLRSGTLNFGASQRSALIPITVLDDRDAEGSETVEVTLSGPGVVEEPSTVTFTIHDNEELGKPSSSIHHPNNRKKYRNTDYRIREIHVFTDDNPGGSGVVAAQFALRRELKNGKCQWWKGGRRFKKGSCQKERWKRMRAFDTDYFYIRTEALPPSPGKISYTAFSRAIDAAGNVESFFDPGRNANTFEVKPGRR